MAAGVPAVPPTAPTEAGCITPPDVPVGRGKFFLFPPVLKDASTFAGLAKRSFSSKTIPRREAIQLYRINRRELEHRFRLRVPSILGTRIGVRVARSWVDYVGIVGVLLGLQGVYGLIMWVVCRVLLMVLVGALSELGSSLGALRRS